MQRLMIGGLSVLLLSLTAVAAARADDREIEPFNLAYMAYQGQFEAQGISSYAILEADVQTGEIVAEDVVQAAIDKGLISRDSLDDEQYLSFVEDHLESLDKDRS